MSDDNQLRQSPLPALLKMFGRLSDEMRQLWFRPAQAAPTLGMSSISAGFTLSQVQSF